MYIYIYICIHVHLYIHMYIYIYMLKIHTTTRTPTHPHLTTHTLQGQRDLGETLRVTLGKHNVPIAVEMALLGAKKGPPLPL